MCCRWHVSFRARSSVIKRSFVKHHVLFNEIPGSRGLNLILANRTGHNFHKPFHDNWFNESDCADFRSIKSVFKSSALTSKGPGRREYVFLMRGQECHRRADCLSRDWRPFIPSPFHSSVNQHVIAKPVEQNIAALGLRFISHKIWDMKSLVSTRCGPSLIAVSPQKGSAFGI